MLKRHTTYNIVLELGFIWVYGYMGVVLWVLDTYIPGRSRDASDCGGVSG
jgi:hypothetical protein